MATLKQRALEFMEGFNHGDLELLMAAFGEDGTFIDPQGVSHHGVQAIRAALAPIVEGSAGNVRYSVTDTIVDEESSKASIAWTLSMRAADGAGAQMRGVDILHFEGERVMLKNCFMKAAELLVEDDTNAATAD